MKKLFQKLRNKQTPSPIVIVSGLPRSGTSMMMKMLEAGGLPPLTDGEREADVDNPKGYYEFERVKKLDKGDTAWLAQAEGKAVKVISALLRHLPADYQYKIIFMERHMSEILASQRKMLVRRGEDGSQMDDAQMAALFAKHVAATYSWIAAQDNMALLKLHYSDVLADPETQARLVNTFLGNTLNLDAMALIVDPDLHRNRKS